MTELFFETVKPENADLPISEILAKLPEGEYLFEGPRSENGRREGLTAGTAWLSHKIPAGPRLESPKASANVATGDVVMSWLPVTLDGEPLQIVAYQLIVEKIQDPHPHIIGKMGSMSMYLPSGVTSITLPAAFFEPKSAYAWDVLAIEESGNQTLSSSEFTTL